MDAGDILQEWDGVLHRMPCERARGASFPVRGFNHAAHIDFQKGTNFRKNLAALESGDSNPIEKFEKIEILMKPVEEIGKRMKKDEEGKKAYIPSEDEIRKKFHSCTAEFERIESEKREAEKREASGKAKK